MTSAASVTGLDKPPLMMVGNFLSASGRNRSVCEDLADHLSEAGWPVTTTSSSPSRGRRLLEMQAAIWSQRRSYSIAQVDVYSGPAFLLAEASCWALRANGKPFILTLHGGNLPAFARRWPLRMRRLLNAAAAVTAPSAYLVEQMRPYCAEIRLLPNPLDTHRHLFRLRSRPQPRLVWLRAFHQIYNPLLAPRVVALLQSTFPGIHLTMVGPDKDGSLQAVQQLARQLGVDQHFSFPGAVSKDDVPRWLEQHDIFLNTTNVDNTPLSMLEAMATGLCVVSTNVGGISYMVQDARQALLVAPDDAPAMAAAIRRVLLEPALAGQLSWQARKTAETYDWSAILPQWDRLLAETLARCDACPVCQ